MKKEAVLALTDAKIHPPVIRGQAVDVGFAKCKNSSVETSVKTVLNFESEKGNDTMLTISAPSPSTRTSALNQPPQQYVLPLFKNDMQDKHFPTGEPLDEPLYAVNVSGYNRKMTEVAVLFLTPDNLTFLSREGLWLGSVDLNTIFIVHCTIKILYISVC